MGESKGPLDRAADRLQELVHLLKHNIIPGMRPKDQKMILDYLLEMVDDLIAAQREISEHRITDAEKKRIKANLEEEFQRELEIQVNKAKYRYDTRVREEVAAREDELRREFSEAIINQHLRDNE